MLHFPKHCERCIGLWIHWGWPQNVGNIKFCSEHNIWKRVDPRKATIDVKQSNIDYK